MSVPTDRRERVESKVKRLGVLLREPGIRLRGIEGGFQIVSPSRELFPPEEPGLPLYLIEAALNSLLTDYAWMVARRRLEAERTGRWLRYLDGAMEILYRLIVVASAAEEDCCSSS
jgi:hypothetical protein